jgi:hypothetical protein
MQKKMGLLAALALATALAVQPGRVAAQDVEPAGFGAGFDLSLASANLAPAAGTPVGGFGVGGLNGNYWVSPSVMLNFMLNAGFALPDGGDLITRLGIGFGVFGVLARGDHTVFMLGGRFTVGVIFNYTGVPDADDNQAAVGLDIPLRIEHWLDRHFAVNGQVGVSVGILPDTGLPFSMGIGTAAAWGSAGFTYYFDAAGGLDGGGGGGGSAPPPAGGGYSPPPQQQQQQPVDPEAGGAGW